MGKLTDEDINNICVRYQAGESSLQLGHAFKVSADTIIRHLRLAGLTVRTLKEIAKTLRRKLNNVQLDAISRRYINGESLDTLAQEFHTSQHTIRRYILDKIKQSDHRRKLTNSDVLEIVKRYQANENSTVLGKAYNVSPANIRRILKKARLKNMDLLRTNIDSK